MPYQVTPTPIPGVLVLEPKVFGDARGFFFESFNQRDFETATGIDRSFVQDRVPLQNHRLLVSRARAKPALE